VSKSGQTHEPEGLVEVREWIAAAALAVSILFLFGFGFVTIQSAVKWGFWPALAEMSYEFVGRSSDVGERLDDCLVKAVASQPLGRLRTLLLNDLNTECGYIITATWLALYADDKGPEEVLDEVAAGHAINEIANDAHFAPIIARAQPRS
jgi:hypothetical protein